VKKLLVLLLAAAALAAVPAAAQAKQRPTSTDESFVPVTGGARDYWLYTPPGRIPPKGRPLVVYLHGCTQNNTTDPQVAFGTRWNELAQQVGAVVLYPLQAAYNMDDPAAVEGNGASCWNWFLDKNMHRGAGEPAILADLTRQIAAANHVDTRRIFVMGTSAGADMANVLNITYPDLFKASAMFAGCPYNACSDVTGTLAAQELAAHGLTPSPAIIFQGSGDTLNVVALGEALLQQQLGMRGISPDSAESEDHGDATAVNPAPAGGNVCVGPHGNWPCLAGATGWSSYPYRVDHYADAAGTNVVDWWLIHGLNHDYPNGDYRSTFTDPVGPDITRAAWDFFTAHS
jgi:poly(hydroxyalkanoate) depolymerase family esterase